MNHIFHYYITGFLALRAGFSGNEAQTIATAAQYVDHALIPFQIHGNEASWRGKPVYQAMATHHFGFWDQAQEDSVWIPFHFFPGGPSDLSNRVDGLRNDQSVKPNSPPVRELLIEALKTNDLFRMGIALHTYADSWAHQNFTGRREDFNRLHATVLLPPIGHAQAESSPDILHADWLDPRLIESRVHNRSRFLESARLIYKYLATNRRQGFADSDAVMGELELMLGPPWTDAEARPLGKGVQANIRKGLDALMSTKSLPLLCGRPDRELEYDFQIATGLPPYDRTRWRQEAFNNTEGPLSLIDDNANLNDKAAWLKHELLSRSGLPAPQVQAKPGFFESALYHWSEAARDHLQSARSIIRQI